ncbi:MAG: Cof-type HAD-IIB family hydrolase [Erysipelotrichaceae bacterium]
MTQLICFDIDGTLNDPATHQVSESCRLALRQLKANGYQLAIATGRNIKSVCESGFHQLIDWDAYICDNGISVLDQNQAIIAQEKYPLSAIKAALDTANKLNIPIAYQNDEGQFLIGDVNENVVTAHQFFHEPIPIKKTYHNETVLMMAVYDSLQSTYASFANIPHLSIATSQSTYADLVLSHVNKYIGIKKLCEHLNLDGYIAFGDAMNDKEMLQHASCAILMGQGDKNLTPYANFITKAVDDDGIYYACKELKLF